MAVRHALTGCAIFTIAAFSWALLCLGCRAAYGLIGLSGTIFVLALGFLIVTIKLPGLTALDIVLIANVLVVSPFEAAWDHWRQCIALCMLIRPSRRVYLRAVLDGKYILLLRRFTKVSDMGLERALRRKIEYIPDPLSGARWSPFGFQHDWGQFPRFLSAIPFPLITLLNQKVGRWGGYVPSAPTRLVLVPASDEQWKDAVEDCAAWAAGVLFLISDLTENIDFELSVAVRLDPERVLILLDVAREDLWPELTGTAAQTQRANDIAEQGQRRAREWMLRCPPELRPRTLPIGAELERDIRDWAGRCGESTNHNVESN